MRPHFAQERSPSKVIRCQSLKELDMLIQGSAAISFRMPCCLLSYLVRFLTVMYLSEGNAGPMKTLARLGVLRYLAATRWKLLLWSLFPSFTKRPVVTATSVGAFYLPTYLIDFYATVDTTCV